MKIGRSAPRHQMIALLYPRSTKLRAHVCEYFIVVVRLFHRTLSITQKSVIGQFTSTLSDVDLKTFQSDLDLWACSIKEEESLLLAERIEEESREGSRSRALASKFFESASLQQRLERNLRVLDFCSSYDYETVWKQTRKIGNTNLFKTNQEYQKWREQAGSRTLLYTGRLGCGKSVLLANIVDDLHLHMRSKDTTVAYLFCQHDIPESLRARTIIGSLARQLLRPTPDLSEATRWLPDYTPNRDIRGISNLLKRSILPSDKAYFILDGLDECKAPEREELIQELRELQEVFSMRLCVSLRLESNNTLKLGSGEFISPRTVTFPEDNPDIEEFIEDELTRCIESKSLILGNPALILEIQDALLKGSQGMFLWEALQIKSLCAMKTDHDIRQTLKNLPRGLPETFSRILQSLEGQGEPCQKRILELLIAAQRPLTTEELREAVSVVPGDPVWNLTCLFNNMFSALACCGSLLDVDEEELSVRFVHPSVKTFFLGGFEDLTNIQFTVDGANKTMVQVILTYLSYGVFDTQLSTTVVPQVKIGSAPSRITQSINASGLVQSLALRLLRSKRTPDYDISKTLAEMMRFSDALSVDTFHFYSYGKTNLLEHVFYRSEKELVLYDLALEVCRRDMIDINAIGDDSQMFLRWAVDSWKSHVIKLLLDSDRFNSSLVATYGPQYCLILLCRGASRGDANIVKMLLDSKRVDVNAAEPGGHGRAIILAASNGHTAVVKMLLDSGKGDPDLQDNNGRTPLLWAEERGNWSIIQLLLDVW